MDKNVLTPVHFACLGMQMDPWTWLWGSCMGVFSIAPLEWEGLLCCFLAAFVIGLERQLQGKPVGIRTSSLICIGTYVFVVMTRHVSNGATDPSRIIGQVVTGIGFLGAGVMLAKDGSIIGVTSAAAIWILAAIGTTIGLGSHWLGVELAILTEVILIGVSRVENRFEFMQRGVYTRSRHRQGADANLPSLPNGHFE
jgi:putative Mg2+ transporter-C (MgtC) family protein